MTHILIGTTLVTCSTIIMHGLLRDNESMAKTHMAQLNSIKLPNEQTPLYIDHQIKNLKQWLQKPWYKRILKGPSPTNWNSATEFN